MSIFAARFLWNPIVRLIAFWGVFVLAFGAIENLWPWIDLELLVRTIDEAVARNDLTGLSSRNFAFSLASALFASALALGAAYFLLHTAMIWLAIAGAKRCIEKTKNMAGFASAYEAVHTRLERHALLSHAWKEFDETLVPPKEAGGFYRNTVRPHTFINMSVLREHLLGLKLIGGIPGYFVGIGLLLTFIGLVLALHKAATAVNSVDAEGMQLATRELLQVATFKFATSIAGLGASILLSFWFKLNLSLMESTLDSFCKAVEQKLRYTAPQSITAEMNDTMAGQLTELKQINSADFFSRMGESISPQIQSAFATAIAPVTHSIDQAVGKLADNSQTGMADMVNSFKESIQGGAGTELRELAATLQGMQGALLEAQRGINGSGEDFGRRMSEAAEHLKRLVSEAGERLDASSEQSREAMVDVVAALRETMEQANRKVDESLGQAATGASGKIEEAMGRVLGRLEEQIDGFNSGLGTFQAGMSRNLEETHTQIAAAQAGAAAAIGSAAANAAQALQGGLGEALATIRHEVERFAAAMRGTEASMTAQSNAVREATDQSRAVADAFSRTAQDVRAASAPLTQSSERIVGATEKMAEAIARSVTALEASQATSRSMADALAQHHDQLASAWASYSQRFENVDKSLAAAVEGLAKAARDQGEVIAKHVQEVDQGFADAIGKLNGLLAGIEENTQDLGEGVGSLRMILLPQAAE
ncbi:MAG: anti-phage defense ZorAB system protein ZorA [Rhizobiaceae bacterium]|nr:anti-phage defense ZorAB system protein ZorA [Rhizobiaceae bacterium]MCV0404873.1 anti-phage defense ZorAB system protein ZorA [Rhizobiaceae bacterium]